MIMEEKRLQGRYFVDSMRCMASATTMQKSLGKVFGNLQHTLLTADEVYRIVEILRDIQNNLWKLNKRLKKVDITLAVNDLKSEYASIYAGGYDVSLHLTRVKEYELEKLD